MFGNAKDILVNQGCVWSQIVLKYTTLSLTLVNRCYNEETLVLTYFCGQLDIYVLVQYPFLKNLYL